jgi:hypothetical protein
VNKIEARTEICQILDGYAEYENDTNYDPDGWLNEYATNSLGQGLTFLTRLKKEKPDALLEIIAVHCLDCHTGRTSWLEAEVSDNFERRHDYDRWGTRVAVVFEGESLPYVPDLWFGTPYPMGLSIDDFTVRRIYIRNYDEG